jgi:type I restriction enzyme M protein
LIFSRSRPADRVWMYQVKADGYTQDALRLPTEANDLPDLFHQWSQRERVDYRAVPGRHGWVTTSALRTAHYDLSPAIHLAAPVLHGAYPTMLVGDLCKVTKGASPAAKTEPGPYPLVTTSEELRSSATYEFDGAAICVPLVSATGHGHASIKRITYIDGKFAAASIVAVLTVLDEALIDPRFLYAYLETNKETVLVPLMKGSANVSLSLDRLSSVIIPIPPRDVQTALVAPLMEIDHEMMSAKTRVNSLKEEREALLAAFQTAVAGTKEPVPAN